MNRRNFMTTCAVGAAGLLMYQFDSTQWPHKAVPMVWDNDKKRWVKGKDRTYYEAGNKLYEFVYIDTPYESVLFTTLIDGREVDSDAYFCGTKLKLKDIERFEKSLINDDNTYNHRFILVNNKNELGFLASEYPCWNFRVHGDNDYIFKPDTVSV